MLGARVVPQCLSHAEAIHPGHLEIHQDQIRLVKARLAEYLVGMGCREEMVAFAREDGAYQVDALGVVIGDQHVPPLEIDEEFA